MTLPERSLRGQEPYDAIPRSVQARTDLTFGAKCLYGALSTAQRTRWQPTYAELAAHLAASTRSIVRWVAMLAEAGLIAVKRRGQGLSNFITVLALAVRSDKKLQPALPLWRQAPGTPLSKEAEKKGIDTPHAGVPSKYTSGALGARYVHV